MHACSCLLLETDREQPVARQAARQGSAQGLSLSSVGSASGGASCWWLLCDKAAHCHAYRHVTPPQAVPSNALPSSLRSSRLQFAIFAAVSSQATAITQIVLHTSSGSETTFSCHFERTLTPLSVLHGAAAGWHLLLRATGCCSCWIPLLQAQAAVAPNPAALPLTQGPRCHTCRPGLSWPPPTSRPASFYDASLVWVCSCPAPLQAAQLHRQIPGQGAPDAHSRHRASQRHTPRHQEGDQTHHPGGEASHMLLSMQGSRLSVDSNRQPAQAAMCSSL